MGIWNLNKVASTLSELRIAEGRELHNLSLWIWEETMGGTSSLDINLTTVEEKKIHDSIHRLASGEPVQYIAGHAWFYGMKLKVTPDVLIPRPETEELVDWIIKDLKNSQGEPVRILDIGTGSGCIAIALKKHLKQKTDIVAIDLSNNALDIARENAFACGVDLKFIQHDFLKDDVRDLGEFDIIVSNPPYVDFDAAGEEMIHKLRFEPSLALFPKNDPDIFYKKIASSFKGNSSSCITCYVEMNEFRADEIRHCFQEKGWSDIEIRQDLQGARRMLKARSGI